MPSARLIAISSLLTTSIIWGIAAVIIKYTLEYFPPFTFLAYRFWLSALAILPIFIWQYRLHQPTWKQLKEVAILTTIGVPINLILVFLGIDRTTALEATFITALVPLFTIAGGAYFLKEKISRQDWYGIALTSLGTLIIILEPILSGHTLTLTNISGNLILLASNVTLAYYTVRSRLDLMHQFSPLFIISIGFLIAPFILTPLTLLEQNPSHTWSLIISAPINAHWGVLYMAMLSGIVAYFLYEYGLKVISATEASILHYLGPLFATPLAILWLKEPFTLPFALGALVIVAGVLTAEYKPHRHRHHLIVSYWKSLSFPEKLATATLLAAVISVYGVWLVLR